MIVEEVGTYSYSPGDSPSRIHGARNWPGYEATVHQFLGWERRSRL